MIIVTGGTHGIGQACVERLCTEGRDVVFTGRDEDAGRRIESTFRGATFVAGDVAKADDCARVVDRALDLGEGRLSGLVNNAGMSRRIAFDSTSAADWDEVMAVNARSAFLFTRLSLYGLRAARGAVVTVGSIAGLVGEEGLAVYCASKAAIIGMTQALALEFGAEVRFNVVCPGQIDTRMMAGAKADPQRRLGLEARIPAERFGAPAEVAELIAWLISPAASYINGAVVPIDGGETAGLRTPRGQFGTIPL